MASAIADGRGLLEADPTGFRTPLYPAFLALFRATFGDHSLLAAVLAQNLLGIAVSLLVGWICWASTRSRWAWVAGYALSAASFGRIQYDQQLLSESLFIFLLAAHVVLVWKAFMKMNCLLAIVAGLTLAAAVLTRPVALLLAPVEVAVLLAVRWRWPKRKEVGAAAAFLLAIAFPLLAWSARNAMRFGDFRLFRPLGVSGWEHAFRPQGAKLEIPSDRAAVLPREIDIRNGWEVASALAGTGLTPEQRAVWMEETVREAKDKAGMGYWTRLLGMFGSFWWENEEAIPFYVRTGGGTLPDGSIQKLVGKAEPSVWWASVLSFFYRYPRWLQGLYSLLSLVAAAYLLFQRGRARLLGALAISWFGYFSLITVLFMYPLYRFRMVMHPMMIAACVTAAIALLAVGGDGRKVVRSTLVEKGDGQGTPGIFRTST